MRILLINPPCGPRTIGLKNIACIEPLGLELVGAGVSGEHDVRLVDMMVRPGDLVETLRQFNPDVVGVTSEIVHVDTAIESLRTVKQCAPDCVTVVGGHHATLVPEDFLDPAVDLVVIGEGVDTFAEICAARAAGSNDFQQIAGLRIRTPNGLKATAVRPLPATLDDQPPPDRSLVDRYRKHYYYLFEKSVAAVRTSLGCTFPCVFCSCRVYSDGAFIPRSPELVFEEIRNLEEDFVFFCDDHSFLDPERMRVLAQMLLDAGVKKRYFAYSRTDSIVENKDVFALWAKAGLSQIMTGLEALDEKALRKTGKGTDLARNEEAIRILDELHINLSAGFLVDTSFRAEDFDAIDRYVKDRPAILLVEYTPLTPFPGTPLYRSLKDRLLTTDTQLYDLQHFILKTDLPPKELYRLMIKNYRKVVFRVIRRLRLWRPHVLFASHTRKVIRGLLRNLWAYRRAHLDVPRDQHAGDGSARGAS